MKELTDRSKLMSKVRQSNTSLEIEVRQILRSAKVGYRVNGKGLPGTPDIVNRSAKWAIFIHGCFWHAHENCKLWKLPSSNQDFWNRKFKDNRERDARKSKELAELGFEVMVVWQCELADRVTLAKRVLSFVSKASGLSVTEKHCFLPGNKVARVVTAKGVETVTVMNHPVEHKLDAKSAFDQAFLRQDTWIRPHPSTATPLRFADLFCGCGGLSLGAREACWSLGIEFTAAFAADKNPDALAVYEENFSPESKCIHDLGEVLAGEFGASVTPQEEALLSNLGRIDIILAGPPCQGNSDLNNRTRRDDPRNSLYGKVARFAEIVRPEHLLIENVPGIIHDRSKIVKKTLTNLSLLGYAVDAGVIDLSAFGVAQRRKRHVLVASKHGHVSISEVVAKYSVPERSVRWCIEDIQDEFPDDLFRRPTNLSKENQQRIAYLFSTDGLDLPNRLRPMCHRDNDHSYKSMYGRLSWDRAAQTITGGFSSPGQGRFIHPSRRRVLTPHESARLQFFPDSFSFSKARRRTSLVEMIGNAVPPKLSFVFCLEFIGGDLGRT